MSNLIAYSSRILALLGLLLVWSLGSGSLTAQEWPRSSSTLKTLITPFEQLQLEGAQDEEMHEPDLDDSEGPDSDAEDTDSAESGLENDRSTRVPSRRRGSQVYSKRSAEFLSVFTPAIGSITDSVVRIADGDDQLALGTIIDPQGLILTKASELKGQLNCILTDGSSWRPAIVGIDPETDLVLLQIEKRGLVSVPLETYEAPAVGTWLATVQQKEVPLAVGIVSHEPREIQHNVMNSAIIGIQPENRLEGDGVRINGVNRDTPAESAGLLVNDIIVGINNDPISNREKLLEMLSHFEPGDDILLKIKRGDEELEVPVTLGRRTVNPMMDRGNRQNRMGSTLSKRRNDFPLALQHDSTINANECGGPVVDLEGRVLGINIARDGRVSTLALPIEVILPVIHRLKSGQWTPEVVNKKEITRVEKELAKLETELGTLPQQKMEHELRFSAGAAVEEELRSQVKEAEERLQALQARLDEKKKENREVSDLLSDLQSKQNRIERKREPLKKDLQRLKTGVQ